MNLINLLFSIPYVPILDCAIVLIILIGAVYGSKLGFVKSTTSFILTIIALILAFVLKNPISVLMYTYLPFINFKGVFEGITSINIIAYEAIAFLVVLTILVPFVKAITKLTTLIEKLLNATVILGIPSKILGAIFGAIEMYIFVFIIIFFLNQFPSTNFLVKESQVSHKMLENTPVLSRSLSNTYNTFNEIYKIAVEFKDSENPKEADAAAFDILLSNEIITPKNAHKLIDYGKINNKLCEEALIQYEKQQESIDEED